MPDTRTLLLVIAASLLLILPALLCVLLTQSEMDNRDLERRLAEAQRLNAADDFWAYYFPRATRSEVRS